MLDLKKNFNKEYDTKKFEETNSQSLKDRYNEEVETAKDKIFRIAGNIWNGTTTVISIILAVLGVITLLHPDLRACLIDLISHFMLELQFLG